MQLHTLEQNHLSLTAVVGLAQPWRDGAGYSYLDRPRPDNGIILIRCRAAAYTFPDGTTLHAPQGSVVVLPEGCRYHVRFTVDTPAPDATLLINFVLRDDDGRRITPGGIPTLLLPAGKDLTPDFRHIIDLCLTQNNLTTKSLLYALLHRLAEAEPTPDIPPTEASPSPDMPRILAYLDLHLTDPALTVPALARRFAMSETTLRRRFRAHTGLSPVAYIAREKLNRACRMLRATSATVDMIATALGYFDTAYFCRRFKAEMGMTPVEYRTAQR